MWRVLTTILALIAPHALAHGGALNYTVGDTWYPGSVFFPLPRSPINIKAIATIPTAKSPCKTLLPG
jgi:hypothetical protein